MNNVELLQSFLACQYDIENAALIALKPHAANISAKRESCVGSLNSSTSTGNEGNGVRTLRHGNHPCPQISHPLPRSP